MQNEAGQRIIEFCQENALVIANTPFQQHKRRLYTWTSPYAQYPNQIDFILCSQRWRSSIKSTKATPGADCGSDHELLITKFRLKLKKVGNTTTPFRYDLNQIPYDYMIMWRRKWQPTPVLPGKLHGWRSLVGYSPWSCKESDTTEQLYFMITQ